MLSAVIAVNNVKCERKNTIQNRNIRGIYEWNNRIMQRLKTLIDWSYISWCVRGKQCWRQQMLLVFLFLILNIKVIGSDIHTSVYDKRDDFGFPIVNFPWLSGDVPRLPSYGVKISQLVRFARCSTCISDFHSKNLQISSKLLTQVYRYHKLRKTFGKFFRSYSDLFI